MEINKVQNIDVYNNQKLVSLKNLSGNKNADVQEKDSLKRVKHEKREDHPEKKKEKQTNNNVEVKQNGAIHISYTIEKDLNIVIANVIDSKTKEKIRQVPPEEIVRNKKLLKAYQESFNSDGKLLNGIAKQKIL